MRTLIAYAAVPVSSADGRLTCGRLTPLHTTAASAARAIPASMPIARITYQVPEGATFNAFAVNGQRLSRGDNPEAVLVAAAELDPVGAGILLSVDVPTHPADTSRLRLALSHAVFGYLDETKSMADYIVAIESTDGRALAA